jgi:hypothetical protein
MTSRPHLVPKLKMIGAILQFPTRLHGFHRNNFTFNLLLFGTEFVYIRTHWSWLEELQQYINGPKRSYLWDTLWGERRSIAHTAYCVEYQWPDHKRHGCPYCRPIYILKYCIQVSVYVFNTVVHQQTSKNYTASRPAKHKYYYTPRSTPQAYSEMLPTEGALNFRTALALVGLWLPICNANSPQWRCFCRCSLSDGNSISKGDDTVSSNAAYFV